MHEDEVWGIHETFWRDYGMRLSKITMDTEDWLRLGWTAQDKRGKHFTELLKKTLPKSDLMANHDARVRIDALHEAARVLEDIAEERREADNGENDLVSATLELAAKAIRPQVDSLSET